MKLGKPLLLAAITLLLIMLYGCDSDNNVPATPVSGAPTPATTLGTPASNDAPVSPERIAQAKKVMEQLVAGDFAGVVATFDQTMAAQLPTNKLQQAWAKVTTKYGAYKSLVDTQSSTQQGHAVVVLTSDFDKGRLDTKIIIDTAGHVSELSFLSGASSPTPTPGKNGTNN